MSWKPKERRWKKLHRGVMYVISCRKLGVPETKEDSWRAANEWFEKQREAREKPEPGEALSKAAKVQKLLQDFIGLDEEGRRQAVDALLGKGAFGSIKAKHDEAASGAKAASRDRTIEANAEAWTRLLHSACAAGQLSVSRCHGYSRDILGFTKWIGEATDIDRIDESTIEGYFEHLAGKIAAKEFSRSTAHIHFVTAKQFVSWMAGKKLIALPSNMSEKRLSFGQGRAAKIETFSPEEVREILDACDESESKTKLYVLMMIGLGMYQSDLGDLRQDEVDWDAGLVTRARSKTKDRGAPVVTYKLWPETFDLLKRHRASSGPLVLTDDNGRPIVERWMENGKMLKRDSIDPAWRRVARKMGKTNHRLGMKHLRKTAASILGTHPSFKYYGAHFLGHSPKGVTDTHYVVPSQSEFFEALDWLRSQILGLKAST